MNTKGMNSRITFVKKGLITTENGFQEEQWIEHYTCWSYVNNLSGKEYWEAMAVKGHNTVVFSVRYCQKIKALNTSDYQLRFNGDTYNIEFIDNVRYENNTVKIKAVKI